MDVDIAPEESAFRDEVRQWLAEHLVGEFAAHRGVGSPTDDTAWEVRVAWEKELAAGGWLGLTWPREYGGRGATLAQEVVFETEYARAAAPARVNSQALGAARADAARVRHRGAEAPLPAAHPERRRHLGPGLQRAGRRLGHRGGVVPGAARRGPVGHRRSEGVDDVRAPGRLAVRRVPHRIPTRPCGTRA